MRTILAYGFPALVLGYLARLIVLYSMKYSTDVLLVAPFIMGIIFGISRIWDAVTDPLVGFLSDKTKSRIGRRRGWIIAGAIPFGLFFAMAFSVPIGLEESLVVIWLCIAIVGFYTAMTVVSVPHLSWGAEMSSKPTERSKLFGARHAFEIIGGLAALYVMSLLIAAEKQGIEYARGYTAELSIWTAFICIILIFVGVATLRENRVPDSATPRGSLLEAVKDVWANPHARLVLFVMLIEFIGGATMGAMALYVAQYVIHAPEIAPVMIMIYLLVQMGTVPFAVKAVQWMPKHKLWLYSMIATGAAFGAMFFLAFIESQTMQITLNVVTVIVAGVAAAVGGTIGPTVLSDIIDYDEYRTSERKEGAYFAVWNFAGKTAGGITIMLAGFVLSAIGFEPNVEQTQTVKVGLTALLGLFPLTCYWIGAWLFSRYQLTEQVVLDIRLELDARQ